MFQAADTFRVARATQPALSRDGGKVLFTMGRDDPDADERRHTVWLADGARVIPVSDGHHDSSPHWAANQRDFVFVRRCPGRPPHIRVQDVSATASRKVPLPGPADRAEWAPGADLLAVLVDAPAGRRLAIVDPFAGWVRIVCSDAQGFAWSPSGVELVVAVGPPGGRVAGLVVVSVEDNRYRLLTRRKGILGDPVWVDPRTVAYVGVRDMSPCGQPTLWAVRTDGNGPRPVLPGLDRSVLTGDGVFPGARPVRFGFGRVACAVRDGGEVAVWVADLAAGVARVLPQTRGQAVTGIAADDFGNLAWTGATENRPSRLFTGRSCVSQAVGDANVWLENIDVASPEKRLFSRPQGRPIEGWLVRGRPGDRVLVDLHGGPHGAWNPFFPEWDLYHQMLVQRGWMVLLPNISGSDGYGGGFRSAIHRVWGPAGQADVLTCLRDLVRDGSRLAVAGYSYGGFLACWLIAAMPELFRAAVVSSAITDLTAFQNHSHIGQALCRDEFGDGPDGGYRLAAQSPMRHVDRVRVAALALHGETDELSPLGPVRAWVAQLRARGHDAELVAFPGCGHLFKHDGPPRIRNAYQRAIVSWLERQIPASPSSR